MWDKIVDIEKCHLQANPSNEIRNTIKDFAQKNKLDFLIQESKVDSRV